MEQAPWEPWGVWEESEGKQTHHHHPELMMAVTCCSSGTSPCVLGAGEGSGQHRDRLLRGWMAWQRWQPRGICQPGARGIVCWKSVRDFGCRMISPHGTRGSECSQVTKAHPALTMVMVGHTKELSGGGEEP